MIAEATHEHVSIVARQGISAARSSHAILFLDLNLTLLVIFITDSFHLTEGQRTILMLNQLMSHKITSPFWFSRRCTYFGVVLTLSSRTPSPDIAVGTIACCLACIETTTIQEAFMVIRPNSNIVGCASLQLVECSALEVLNLAHERSLVTIYEIPPVAHLEDIGALIEAVPHHGHESTVVSPRPQVIRNEVSNSTLTILSSGNQHVILAIITFEEEWVTEVILAITVVITFQDERLTLCPSFEIGRSGVHDGLAILRSSWIILVSCVESIVELAAFIVYGRTRTDCRILFIDVTTRYQLAKRLIVGSILGAYRPNWVVSACWIRTEVLQVHYLEVTSHRVVERHWVTHITNSWLVISALCCLVGRTEVRGRRPIFLL